MNPRRALLIGGLFTSGILWAFPPVEELPVQEGLPDPFRMMDGTSVKTRAAWEEKRRPELKRLFQHYLYGYFPAPAPIKAVLVKQDASVLNELATYREVEIQILLPEKKRRSIYLSLFIPKHRTQPAPVFLTLNWRGNHTITSYPGVTQRIPSWISPAHQADVHLRGSDDSLSLENTLRRGFAVATFCLDDIDPDKPDVTPEGHPIYSKDLTKPDRVDGIQTLFAQTPGDSESKWGTIAAWSWGLMRAIDYLETDPEIDSKKICLEGWSRLGKTVLLTAAMDERVALVIPHQSGTAGTSLSRGNPKESVERINYLFPHWFNGNFKKWTAQNLNRLPIDQHLLIALVAPRPLLDTEGLQDRYVDPDVALQALKAASPVYEFLGVSGIQGAGVGSQRDDIKKSGHLFQFRLDTPHDLTLDYWNVMIDFAKQQLR